jgi:hydrophobe/amphiphile efflux-1 (HAE1) family protein
VSLAGHSVRNPVTTWTVFIAALMVGAVCLFQMPIDLLPEMDLPSITVMTEYEGAAPEDVESKVTEILERRLAGVPELKHIISTSKEDLSIITLSFEWGTDLDARANEVRDLVGMTKSRLPEDIEEPRVLKFDVSRIPVLAFGVKARESFPHLEKILQDEVEDRLKRVSGVAAATARVPLVRQVNIDLDRERLAAYGLTPLDVARVVSREHADTPAGDIKIGLDDYLLRVPGEFERAEDMRSIVLAARNGAVVRLEDVGTATDAFKDIERYTRIDGHEGAMIMVQKESEANTVKVAKAVHKRMEEIKPKLPADIEIVTVMDSSEDIRRLIQDLSSTLLQGGLLCMVVVLVFLRKWRATFVIGMTIPFSVILGIIANYFLGFTINMITLFSFIIAVGMIVDNSIVVLENIMSHRTSGERPAEAAVYATDEVAMPIAASTLTTVCIFFPILFVKGITKIIFGEFAIVVSVTLLASLFTALTMTPMLSSRWLRGAGFEAGAPQRPFFAMTERWLDAVSDAYGRLLAWALRHRKSVILIALALFGSSLLLLPRLGSEFMPDEDKGSIRGDLWMPVGTRVEATAKVMQAVQEILMEEVAENERVAAFTSCGVSDTGGGSIMGEEGTHIGSFGVKLVPKVRRKRSVQEIASNVRRRLDEVKDFLGITKYQIDSGNPMAGLITGGEQPLTINIIGNDMEVTDVLAARIKQIAENTPGAVDVGISREKGRPELWLQVDRAKASAMGLNVADVGDTVRASFYGETAAQYHVAGDEYDVFVRLRADDRTDRRDVLAVPVRTPEGPLVRADNLAVVETAYGPVEIERKDQGRIVNVTGNVQGRSLGDVVADIEREIAKLEIPPGVEVLMGGQTEEQREAFFWLTLSLAVGVILVYLVMAAQFESWMDPFVVMFSVPFAFTGTFWLLPLLGHHLSVVVFIGMLLLVGVVVNNAIVLVDYTNILRARGRTLAQAVPEAGKARLRPVLMTALTTILALIPMAFGKGQGSEIWNPLGATVLGGLSVSTLVTLVLVPVMYSLLETHVRRTKQETAAETAR